LLTRKISVLVQRCVLVDSYPWKVNGVTPKQGLLSTIADAPWRGAPI